MSQKTSRVTQFADSQFTSTEGTVEGPFAFNEWLTNSVIYNLNFYYLIIDRRTTVPMVYYES